MRVVIHRYIATWASSPWAELENDQPWSLVGRLPQCVRALIGRLPADDYHLDGDVAIHKTAQVEPGAVLKGPLILGRSCWVAAGAYLRGGNWFERDCTIGPGSEV